MTEAQFAKLPRFARYHIEKLRADLAYARRQADILQGNTKTNVMLGYYSAHPIYLPEGDPVVFVVNREEPHAIMVNLDRHDPQRLRISATSSRLWVEPQAANVIEVWSKV